MSCSSNARSRWSLVCAGFVFIAVLAAVLTPTPSASAAVGETDFFVVHASAEAVGDITNAGAVSLLSLDPNGSPAASSLVHQGVPGLPGLNEAGDRFGGSSTWGDFDGNGTDDLIVGAASEGVGSIDGAGAITVLYDAASGSFSSASLLHQGSPGVPGINETGDGWGASAASGDLNGDGYDDAIIGAPFEDIGDIEDAGAITVLYGSPSGLSGDGAKLYHQDSPGLPGSDEAGDQFGLSVAIAGETSGSSMYAAVGAPGEDVKAVANAGAVTLFGTDSSGLVPTSPLLFAGASASRVRPQMPSAPSAGDALAFRLVGSLDGSLAIAAPYGDAFGRVDAGYVIVYEGFYGQPTAVALYQDVASSIEDNNQFGFAIDVELINGRRTLAVGARGDTVDGQVQAGSVTVIPNNGTATNWTQNSEGVPGVAEHDDFFGSYVDLLPSGALFVGAPGEDVGSTVDAGAGVVFSGSPSRPTANGVWLVHQDSPGIPGIDEAGDSWGDSSGPAMLTAEPPSRAPAPRPTAPPRPTATPRPAPAPTPRPDPGPSTGDIASNAGTHLGANVSKGSFPKRYEAVLGFERKIGRQLSIINRFHEFSAGLTSTFYWDRLHIEDGRTVMMSWRATDNANTTAGKPDPGRAKKIVDGRFDRQIDAMANKLRDLGAPILLRFNWEMDQDRGDPQFIGEPADFIAAWRYVHRRFQRAGATNVEWVWAPRAASFKKDTGPPFYPGDAYVDWIGGSAVPVNSFRDAETIYGDWNSWASARDKPQLLWIGLRENPNDARWKAKFLNELETLISGPWSGVKAIVYYNSFSPTGLDYRIDTSGAATRAFKQMACNAHFETTDAC